MNLFFLDIDPKKCAIYHCDKHIVKMILEIVQMLYTAHIVLKSINLPINHYRKISNHIHPTAVWIRICKENYLYAAEIAISIAHEYTFRYGRVHSCESHAIWLKNNLPKFDNLQDYSQSKKKIIFATNDDFSSLGMTPIPLCMPEDCYLTDPIKSYRKYYLLYKKYFVRWTSRSFPYWFYFFDIRKMF
jgi:hypothetical protein